MASSINNASITTSEEILDGAYSLVVIKNTSLVKVTISTDATAVADVGYPLDAGATLTLDLRAHGVARIRLSAVANSGTGSLSILAI